MIDGTRDAELAATASPEAAAASYSAIFTGLLDELPPFPAPLDAWAFWHNALWAGELATNFPSLLHQLYAPAEEHCQLPFNWTPYRRRPLPRPARRLLCYGAFGNVAGYKSLPSWRPQTRRPILATATGMKHLPSHLLSRAGSIETPFLPPVSSDVADTLESQIEMFRSVCSANHLNVADFLLQFLRDRITSLCSMTLACVEQCEWRRPDAIVCEADNYGWGLAASLAGRATKIPALAFAHGLDCDPWAYDHAFASIQVVWGEWRRKRFVQESRYPFDSFAIGRRRNAPRFEPTKPRVPNRNLLWLTRPHVSEKCYTPEYDPKAGLEIARQLLEFTRRRSLRLTIKPHPSDYIDLYSHLIHQGGFAADLFTGPIEEAIANADSILGEDSTATAEAVYSGKPLALVGTPPPLIPFHRLGIETLHDEVDFDRFLNSPFLPGDEDRRQWLDELFGGDENLDWESILSGNVESESIYR